MEIHSTRSVLQPNTRREESYMHFPEGGQSPEWLFSECEKASVDEGLINNTLQGSRLPYDADSVSTYCNQGYKARVLENSHHPHVLEIRAIKPEFLKRVTSRP